MAELIKPLMCLRTSVLFWKKVDDKQFYFDDLEWSKVSFDAVDWEALNITLTSNPHMYC